MIKNNLDCFFGELFFTLGLSVGFSDAFKNLGMLQLFLSEQQLIIPFNIIPFNSKSIVDFRQSASSTQVYFTIDIPLCEVEIFLFYFKY